ncbi:MAG: SRPBCC family protein [Terracidiphilus sp.]
MTRIDKEILINAPVEKIYNFVIKPSDLLQIWPSLMQIKNEQLLPNGGYSAKWVYKMGGLYFKGTGEVIDIVPGRWFTFQTKGSIKSKITWTFRSSDGQTKVTFTIEYGIPFMVLNWLTEIVVGKINDQEATLLLTNLQVRMEDNSPAQLKFNPNRTN